MHPANDDNLENRRGSDVTVGSNPTPTAHERPLTRQLGRGPFSYALSISDRRSR